LKGLDVSAVLDSVQIEWHDNAAMLTPAASVESLNSNLVEQRPIGLRNHGADSRFVELRCDEIVTVETGKTALCGQDGRGGTCLAGKKAPECRSGINEGLKGRHSGVLVNL